MGRLNVSELEPGMILESDVATPQGMALAKAGTAIEARHLKAFRAWGVTAVAVEDADRPSVSALATTVDDETRARLTETVDHLFRLTDRGDPMTEELHRLALRWALERGTV